MNRLAELQRALARHIRDPGAHPPPEGVEPRRLRIHGELVYATVEGFIAGGFPVLRSLHDDDAWHALVRRFLATHGCQTPYFLRIAEEFLGFLRGLPDSSPLPPFAQELAHYEWVELALDVSTESAPDFLPGADLLDGVPVLSPLAWPLAYAWPVHRIGPAFRPGVPPASPTCLLVYRDGADRVRFVESNPVTLRLLELLSGGTLRGREALDALAAELGPAGSAIRADAGREVLQRLAALGVLGVPRL
jgi:hypothetical protein